MSGGRFRARDEGFSLTELMIVLGLMGVVLAAIYSASNAMIMAAQVSESQSIFARDSGEPMRLIIRQLMQAIQLENTTAQSVTFRTDRQMNGTGQRIIVDATSAGWIRYREWSINSAFVNTTVAPRVDFRYSDSCVNVSKGVSLFRYYRDDRTELTGAQIAEVAPSAARTIVMTLALRARGSDFETSQTVYLRNRATE